MKGRNSAAHNNGANTMLQLTVTTYDNRLMTLALPVAALPRADRHDWVQDQLATLRELDHTEAREYCDIQGITVTDIC